MSETKERKEYILIMHKEFDYQVENFELYGNEKIRKMFRDIFMKQFNTIEIIIWVVDLWNYPPLSAKMLEDPQPSCKNAKHKVLLVL